MSKEQDEASDAMSEHKGQSVDWDDCCDGHEGENISWREAQKLMPNKAELGLEHFLSPGQNNQVKTKDSEYVRARATRRAKQEKS